MTAGQTPQSESDRREAAVTWLARLQSDDASEADWLRFEAWLADPGNKVALDAVEAAIAEFDANSDQILAGLRKSSKNTLKSSSAPARGSWKWTAAGVAIAAAAAIFIGPRLIPAKTPEQAYVAPADSIRVVALPDGSTARLNRGASINVRWSANERRIVLDHGEVAFSVVHDSAHPFVVTVADATIRDVGTEFNVLRRSPGLTVTVREGAVEIRPAGAAPVTVSAGGEFRIDGSTHQATLSRSNANDAFAWEDGRLVYHDATLAMIVDDMNRYAETPIRIADPTLGGLHFSGALVIQPSAGLVSQLQALLPVRSELGKGEILLKKR